MSIEIWQTTQKMTASEMYEDVKEHGYQGTNFFRSDTFAVLQLTNACAEMIATYNEITDDQTSYLLELDSGQNEIESLHSEVEEQIQKLMAEIKALEQKKSDGIITEEEEADLKSKTEELSLIQIIYGENIKLKTEKLESGADERLKESRSKTAIAQDYGETTVEKGTPLAETKVKGGFFRKLFGSTGKNKKRIGENAVKTGNELLDKVSVSVDLDNDIGIKLKKSC